LIILFKGHYLGGPGGTVDLTGCASLVKGLMNPSAEFNATTGLRFILALFLPGGERGVHSFRVQK
jgi:hypothetical protein